MAYLGTLEGWEKMKEIFTKHGLNLDYDLDNVPYFTTIADKEEEYLLEYDELPEECKKALSDFADKNNLND